MRNSQASNRKNVWGDDHPEKLKSTSETIGLRQQLGGLFNPDKFFKPTETHVSKTSEKKLAVKPNETLLFSYSARHENHEMQKETQVLLSKLREQITVLESSEKSLSRELTKVKVDHMPAKTGIYYIRYLEWLLTVVKDLHIKVNEGRAWLAEFSKRKNKKMGYWKMYKKHGTTFGLSDERKLSTSSG